MALGVSWMGMLGLMSYRGVGLEWGGMSYEGFVGGVDGNFWV